MERHGPLISRIFKQRKRKRDTRIRTPSDTYYEAVRMRDERFSPINYRRITDNDIRWAATRQFVTGTIMTWALLSGARMSGSALIQLLGALMIASMLYWPYRYGLQSKRNYPPFKGAVISIMVVWTFFVGLLLYGTFQTYRLNHGWFW